MSSLRKCYTLTYPSSSINNSGSTLCTEFGKQQKSLKAAPKMSGWILVWWNVEGKRWTVEIPVGYKVKGNEQKMRKRKVVSQCPKLFIFSLAYYWCNTENRKTANMWLRYKLSMDYKNVTMEKINEGEKTNKNFEDEENLLGSCVHNKMLVIRNIFSFLTFIMF